MLGSRGWEDWMKGGNKNMAYIPEKHKKYNLLPMSQNHHREVFSYPSGLLCKLNDAGEEEIDPYGYYSY